jgi:hypothetical protein
MEKGSTMKTIPKGILKPGALVALAAGLWLPASVARGDELKTVTGEVVDLMCYLDHGAKGAEHAACAENCIKSGGPVGLLTKDDQLYLVIGDHKPINKQLASHAAKTITIKGKVVERHGMKMIENIQIMK